jgi:hypothetical protein
MHKVLFFDRYHPTPPSESKHKVNLVASTTDRRVIAEGLSLQELYDNHVDHGKILYMVDPVLKKVDGSLSRLQENNVQSSNNNFALLAAGSVPFNIKNSQKARKQHGALKNTIFLLSSPPEYTRLALDRSYQFISHGSPVEFRIRLSGPGQEKKEVPGQHNNPDLLPWMFEHFPHMRPDFILKSMPAGTQYMVQPFTNGGIVQFVLAMPAQRGPKIDLTVRLERVKKRVVDTVPVNKMAQNYLVKQERRARIAKGTPHEVIIEERRKEKDIRTLKYVSTPQLNGTFDTKEKRMLAKMEAKRMTSVKMETPEWKKKMDKRRKFKDAAENDKEHEKRMEDGEDREHKKMKQMGDEEQVNLGSDVFGQTAERWSIRHRDAGGKTVDPPKKNRWDGRGSQKLKNHARIAR